MVRRAAHRRQHGQMLPLIALSALLLFAFAALAIDGGTLLSDRRADQSATDHAALAGAQDLADLSQPLATRQKNARQRSVEYLMRNLGLWTGTLPSCTYTANIDPGNAPTTCNIGSGWDVWVTTPFAGTPPAPYTSADTSFIVEVKLQQHAKGALLGAAGLSNALTVGAHALAFSAVPLHPRSHAVWSSYNRASGGGNTLTIDGAGLSGIAQVDDGSNGSDCQAANAPDVFSDEKVHVNLVAGSGNAYFNINGGVNISKADHDQNHLLQWWTTTRPAYTQTQDPDPQYVAPTNVVSAYSAGTVTVSGSAPNQVVEVTPGIFQSGDDLTAGASGSWHSATWTGASTFKFYNGVYFFNGAKLTFSAGTYQAYNVGGTKASPQTDYDTTANGGIGGFTGRHAGADGTTNGVEFYFAGNSYLWAKGGIVNFQAPTTVSSSFWRTTAPKGVTPLITVYMDNTVTGDTGLTVDQQPGSVKIPFGIGPSSGTAYPAGQYFHEQGTVYMQNTSTQDSSYGAYLTPGSLDLRKYVVQGQLIASYVGLVVGNVSGAVNHSGTCWNDTTSNPGGAGKLVKYDPNNIPGFTAGEGSLLVQ